MSLASKQATNDSLPVFASESYDGLAVTAVYVAEINAYTLVSTYPKAVTTVLLDGSRKKRR